MITLFLCHFFSVATADNATYTITCGESECKDQIINCVDNMNCNIICDEQSACYEATIHCPSNGKCSISCAGSSNACYEANIYGDYSTDLRITDVLENGLRGARIYCPSNASCLIAIDLEANSAEALASAIIYGENANDLTINVPSKYGFMFYETDIHCPAHKEDIHGQIIQNCRINIDPTNGIGVI